MSRTDLVVTLAGRLYAVERPWGRLPAGRSLAYVSHVAVDSTGHVYVYQRGDPPVVIFDPGGGYAGGWGSGLIADAHGLFMTADDHLWLVDRDAHQVLCFTTDGRPVMALGERHRPRFGEPFNHPTDVAVAADGAVYVSDGYGNARVHRFDADGRWRHSWGGPGRGAGEFTTPHAVWVDRAGRVLVADRENDRVQLFTPEGEHLADWPDHYHPMDIFEDRDGRLLVTDQIPRLSAHEPDGRLVGRCRPVLYGAHGLWGDAAGNLYLAEASPMDRITRLAPLS